MCTVPATINNNLTSTTMGELKTTSVNKPKVKPPADNINNGTPKPNLIRNEIENEPITPKKGN